MQRAFALCSAILLIASALPAAEDTVEIRVRADRVIGPVSRYLTGACIEDVNHEIYGGLYSQMIFGESFQEPGPPPRIAGFTAHGGRWKVVEESLQVDAADGPKLVSNRPAFKDGRVGVEILFADGKGENAGLIVRVDRPGTGADNFIGYEIALDPARQMLRLARHRHNYELIRDMPCEVPIDHWIPLEVSLEGPAIEILVGGKSVLRHDDGEQTLGPARLELRGWHRQVIFRKLWTKTKSTIDALPFQSVEDGLQISGMWKPVRHRHGDRLVCHAAPQVLCEQADDPATPHGWRRGAIGASKTKG